MACGLSGEVLGLLHATEIPQGLIDRKEIPVVGAVFLDHESWTFYPALLLCLICYWSAGRVVGVVR
jgi:hypothetical protein